MTQLAIWASISMLIDPHAVFGSTGLEVTPDERHSFVSTGKRKEWYRVVDATDCTLGALRCWNRVPGESFFSLCGGIGASDRNSFANDWRCMHFNNHELPAADSGSLQVAIVRVAYHSRIKP